MDRLLAERGILIRNVTKQECRWLTKDLPGGAVVYKFKYGTFGTTMPGYVAVVDRANQEHSSYDIPLDSVRWEKTA